MTGRYATAVRRAAQDAARYLTGEVQREAAASGWDSAVAGQVHVVFRNDRFEVEAAPNVMSQVQDLEYGTQSSTPSPAIRRVSNRTSDAERVMYAAAFRYLKGAKK